MANTINRIAKLKKIGSFKNFIAPTDIVFNDVNLFYGYNGSGKTTLTRVLSCLNDGICFPDFESGEIEVSINTECIKKISETNIKNKIKVFNTDFVENNLELKSQKAKKLAAIIGKDNITTRMEIERLEADKSALYNTKGELIAKSELDVAIKAADDVRRDVASDIRTYLHIENAQTYRIDHFSADYSSYKPTEATITEEVKKGAGEFYLAPLKPAIDDVYITKLNTLSEILLVDNYIKIFDLLKKPIKRKSTQIKEEVIKWIEEGTRLHEVDHNKCQFCGQTITPEHWADRTSEIKELIKKDDEFEELEIKFSAIKNAVEGYRQTLLSFSCDLKENDFFTKELFTIYQTKRADFDKTFADFSLAIKGVMEKIEEKAKSKDSEIVFGDKENFTNKINVLNDAIIDVKSTIEKNNTDAKKSDKLKEQNKKTVINFYIQQNKTKIDAADANVIAKNAAYEQAKGALQQIVNDMNTKRATLENQRVIIERINGLLDKILDVGLRFKVEPGSDEYFIERRINEGDNQPATNLSEGEKNLVAFLYFLVSLESSSDEHKKNEIIVIDDPVSSLDSGNLFNIGNLILKVVRQYGQVFFLTHNFYFFAKIREAVKAFYRKRSPQEKERVAIFEVENIKGQGSCIKQANEFIASHVSEYMSVVEKLKAIYNSGNDERDISTGNLIRRVLEVFLSFKIPQEQSLYSKFQKMVEDESKYRYLLNMAHAFSHTSEIASITDVSDFSYMAGKQEIEDLFKFIRDKDEKHFKGFGIKLGSEEALSLEQSTNQPQKANCGA